MRPLLAVLSTIVALAAQQRQQGDRVFIDSATDDIVAISKGRRVRIRNRSVDYSRPSP